MSSIVNSINGRYFLNLLLEAIFYSFDFLSTVTPSLANVREGADYRCPCEKKLQLLAWKNWWSSINIFTFLPPSFWDKFTFDPDFIDFYDPYMKIY